jgi:hypothetical protein
MIHQTQAVNISDYLREVIEKYQLTATEIMNVNLQDIISGKQYGFTANTTLDEFREMIANYRRRNKHNYSYLLANPANTELMSTGSEISQILLYRLPPGKRSKIILCDLAEKTAAAGQGTMILANKGPRMAVRLTDEDIHAIDHDLDWMIMSLDGEPEPLGRPDAGVWKLAVALSDGTLYRYSQAIIPVAALAKIGDHWWKMIADLHRKQNAR